MCSQARSCACPSAASSNGALSAHGARRPSAPPRARRPHTGRPVHARGDGTGSGPRRRRGRGGGRGCRSAPWPRSAGWAGQTTSRPAPGPPRRPAAGRRRSPPAPAGRIRVSGKYRRRQPRNRRSCRAGGVAAKAARKPVACERTAAGRGHMHRVSHPRRGSGGQRHDWNAAQFPAQLCKPLVSAAATGNERSGTTQYLQSTYSGRKSCPHSDTQCASSIAISLMPTLACSWLHFSFHLFYSIQNHSFRNESEASIEPSKSTLWRGVQQ